MSKQQLLEQIKQNFKKIEEIDTNVITDNPQFQKLTAAKQGSKEEFIVSLNRVKEETTLIGEIENTDQFSHSMLNSINAGSQNSVNTLTQFAANVDQGQFNNAFAQIDSLLTLLNQFNIKILAAGDFDPSNRIKSIDDTISKSKELLEFSETLKEKVESLVEPAVASSLYLAFSEQAGRIKSYKDTWLRLTATTAIASICATIAVVIWIAGGLDDLNVFSTPSSQLELVSQNLPYDETASSPVADSEELKKTVSAPVELRSVWDNVPLWILRLGILAPFYGVFFLSYSQFRRERELEEEYSHKSAVAVTLPNYSELALDPKVKDQILSEAAAIVFKSPAATNTSDKRVKTLSVDEFGKIASSVKDVVASGENVLKQT